MSTSNAGHPPRVLSAWRAVAYAAERPADSGDAALLAEAVAEARVFVTKDRDIGTLVHRDLLSHCGVLLIDDLGDPAAEIELILAVLASQENRLAQAAFLRAGSAGVREALTER